MSYLNLDLLYVLDNYTFPLFYYSNKYRSFYKVYSPMTLKSIFKDSRNYYDYLTKKTRLIDRTIVKFDTFEITEKNAIYYENNICESFKLSKKDISFLKSNIRIN